MFRSSHPNPSLRSMPPIVRTTLLLLGSNVFMTFAWYAHLRNLRAKPLIVAIAISWGIAFFEYMLQVPANRLGYGTLSLAQLKVLQEAITLTVFVPFAILYMRQPIKTDFLWAGLCLVGAVYFVFRAGQPVLRAARTPSFGPSKPFPRSQCRTFRSSEGRHECPLTARSSSRAHWRCSSFE